MSSGEIFLGIYEGVPPEDSSPILHKDNTEQRQISFKTYKIAIIGVMVFILVSILTMFFVYMGMNGVKCINDDSGLEPVLIYFVVVLYFTSLPVTVAFWLWGYKIFHYFVIFIIFIFFLIIFIFISILFFIVFI